MIEDTTQLEAVLLNILDGLGKVPATKLVKLFYLCDYVYFQHFGETMTGLTYQWDHYGPNAMGHQIISVAEQHDGVNFVSRKTFDRETKYFSKVNSVSPPPLRAQEEMVLADVLFQFGTLNTPTITAATKAIKPFQIATQYDILKMERQFPAVEASAEDVENHFREMDSGGTTLDELKERYGIGHPGSRVQQIVERVP